MYEYLIYSVGALSKSFINKFYILFNEKNQYLSNDLEFIYDMSYDNHLKCDGNIINSEKYKYLSYFQNIKKEKIENLETRIMGVAKIELNKNNNLYKTYFTSSINTLGHCEMAIIKIKYDFNNIISKDSLEINKKCRLLKNNHFIGLTIKILNLNDKQILNKELNNKLDEEYDMYNINLFMIIGLTNGNILIVKLERIPGLIESNIVYLKDNLLD